MQLIEKLVERHLRKDIPDFRPGDTLRVHTKVREGDKERIQIFEGVVISRRRGGIQSSFIVRKTSYGVGVERAFPLHSPMIDRVEVVTKGHVRRSKLTYLRKLTGKSARIKSEKWEEVAKELADVPEEPSGETHGSAPR